MDDLKRLGVPGLPAVAIGDRVAHGWNPPAYAALLGVRYEEAAKLSPADLAKRLDRVLESAERLLRVVPDSLLDFIPPERKRTIRDLGHHLFRVALSYPDAMDRGELPRGWFEEKAPATMADAHALASYGALVRGRLAGWFEGTGPQEFVRVIQVYYGPQSAHELLERTTWHAGQHLRQLYDLAARLGITPPGPLPADALAGLPLPEAVW